MSQKSRNISNMQENTDFVKTVLVALENGLNVDQITHVLKSCVEQVAVSYVTGSRVNENDRIVKAWNGSL